MTAAEAMQKIAEVHIRAAAEEAEIAAQIEPEVIKHPGYMGRKDAVAYLGITIDALKGRVKRGEIVPFYLGRNWAFTMPQLDAHIIDRARA